MDDAEWDRLGPFLNIPSCHIMCLRDTVYEEKRKQRAPRQPVSNVCGPAEATVGSTRAPREPNNSTHPMRVPMVDLTEGSTHPIHVLMVDLTEGPDVSSNQPTWTNSKMVRVVSLKHSTGQKNCYMGDKNTAEVIR